MRHVPDIAKAELARLRAAGITPTDDEIVWLASLGWTVTNPSSGPLLPSAHGVTVGPLTLYPQTIQASIWLDRFGRFFADTGGLYAVAYAMVRGRTVGAFVELVTLSESVRAVTEFQATCPVSIEELVWAVEQVQSHDAPTPEVDEDDSPPPSYERTIAAVVAATGIPHEHWYTKTITDVADVLLLRRSMDSDTFDLDKYESQAALADMLRAVNQIREAHAQG